MSQVVQLRRSSTQGNVPTTAQIELGELAINTYDGKLFIKKNNGADVMIDIMEEAGQLKKITEGGNTGWALLGRDRTKKANTGVGAVDFSVTAGSTTSGMGASGENSVAFGENVIAAGENSMAVGSLAIVDPLALGAVALNGGRATGVRSTAIGGSIAVGHSSFAAGNNTHAEGKYSFSAGINSRAYSQSATAHGSGTLAYSGPVSTITAKSDTNKTITLTSVFGISTTQVITINNKSFKVYNIDAGNNILTLSDYLDTAYNVGDSVYANFESGSYAEGFNTVAKRGTAHVEGSETTAEGSYGSHAEGYNTTASGEYSSHSEGYLTTASGKYGSHAEGSNTTASGNSSHSEGEDTTASGEASHVEGHMTIASGNWSHAEGLNTIALNIASHAQGKYNVGTATDTIHETGIGADDTNRANAFEIYTDGTLTAPECTNTLIGTRGVKALVTKEYADSLVGASSVDDLTDVDTSTSTPTTGQVLKWDGTNWVPGNDSVKTTVSLTENETTATSGQTAFVVSSTIFTDGECDVFTDGLRDKKSTYSVSDDGTDTTVSFSSGKTTGQVVDIVVYTIS